jgi:DNA polymerase-3 subunit beta
MKLICTKENFKKAIFNSERVVSKQTTLLILNNILFEADKNILKVSATNLEIGIVSKIGAKIEKTGKITIPAKTISGFVNNLPPENENIFLEAINQELKIKSGSLKAIIKGLSAEDFPLIPPKKADFLFSIPVEILKSIISKTLPCVAFNEIRQELTGVNIVLTEKDIFFAATDSFRLSESGFKLKTENINQEIYNIFIKKINNLIVPANTLVELLRVISGESADVIITIEEGQIFFEVSGIKIVSRLINGKYPEYKHIIPGAFGTKIILDKNLIQSAVKMASVFTQSKSGEIFLEADLAGKKIIIGAKNSEVGENSSEIKVDITGQDQRVVFNPRYLLDGLSSISSKLVAILINNETSPVALKEIDEKTGEILDGYIYIVMPIKN